MRSATERQRSVASHRQGSLRQLTAFPDDACGVVIDIVPRRMHSANTCSIRDDLAPGRRLVRAPGVQGIRAGDDRHVCYNALAGTCAVLNDAARRLLDGLANPVGPQARRSSGEDEASREAVTLLVERRLVLPAGRDLRARYRRRLKAHLSRVADGRVLRNLTLVVNEACNFSCLYCLENAMVRAGGRAGEKGRRMSRGTLDAALHAYFAILREQGARSGEIGFSGGEPLLNWPLVRAALAEASRLGRASGLQEPVRFGFNTNGSLMTEDVAAEIGRYPVRALTVGLDGAREGSDRLRRYRNGRGAYDAALQGLRTARRHIDAAFGVNAVLRGETWDAVTTEFIEAMRGEGVTEVTVEPDLVEFPGEDVEELAARLVDLFEHGRRIGLNVTGNWVRPAWQLRRSAGIPMFHCLSQGGGNITVTSAGRVAACAYCSPTFGHVSALRDVLRSPAYREFIRRRFNSAIAACRGCAIEGACAGGCYATVDGRPLERRRCELYRLVTARLLARWAAGTAETT